MEEMGSVHVMTSTTVGQIQQHSVLTLGKFATAICHYSRSAQLFP